MPLTEKQQEYLDHCTHRWNIKAGATGSGKSFMDCAVTIPLRIEALKGEGLAMLIGNTRGTLNRNVLEPMREIWPGLVSEIRSDNTLEIFGRKCYALGADNVKHVNRLRGATIEYCYGDEVTTWSPDVFDMLKSRLRCKHSHFDGTCNPDSPQHWFHEFLQSDADIYQQAYTIDDNPTLPPEFVENLKKEYAGTVLYDRYINGMWVAAEGALFTTYPKYTDDATLFRDGIAHIDAAYGGEDFTALTIGKRQGDTLYLYGRLWHKHVDTVLETCIEEAKRLLCAPILCETNADKGYLAKEIQRRGYSARPYPERMNKHLKISTFLRKWWGNVVFLTGTDKAYQAQILSYTEDAEHDDAPDSAACVARHYDRRGGGEYKSPFEP
ncbi:MAG: terminase family protein [Clostridia bacterium]|nr:terminase family protein [Clostridia bacterium]